VVLDYLRIVGVSLHVMRKADPTAKADRKVHVKAPTDVTSTNTWVFAPAATALLCKDLSLFAWRQSVRRPCRALSHRSYHHLTQLRKAGHREVPATGVTVPESGAGIALAAPKSFSLNREAEPVPLEKRCGWDAQDAPRAFFMSISEPISMASVPAAETNTGLKPRPLSGDLPGCSFLTAGFVLSKPGKDQSNAPQEFWDGGANNPQQYGSSDLQTDPNIMVGGPVVDVMLVAKGDPEQITGLDSVEPYVLVSFLAPEDKEFFTSKGVPVFKTLGPNQREVTCAEVTRQFARWVMHFYLIVL
jgi:hypothetical protein